MKKLRRGSTVSASSIFFGGIDLASFCELTGAKPYFCCFRWRKGAHFVHENQGFTPMRLVDPVRECGGVARTLRIDAC